MQFPSGMPWIAVDWGTSRLRVWRIDNAAAQLITDAGPGMNQLAPNQFESTLLEILAPVLAERSKNTDLEVNPTIVLACGMVGAKQGWQEAPYRLTPCTPISTNELMQVNTTDRRISMYIVPGLSQHEPADVMRGEETLIAGLLKQHPNFTGCVCLPGTHCKWVSLIEGEVIGFNTTLTGELFQLLSEQSILRNDINSHDWDDDAFESAILEINSNPSQLIRSLFSIRAESLLHATTAAISSARLSGLLIGSDIASVPNRVDHNCTMIIGQSDLAKHYQQALHVLGIKSECLSMETLILDGLKHAIPLTNEA